MEQAASGSTAPVDLSVEYPTGSRRPGPVLVRASAVELAVQASADMSGTGKRPAAFCADFGRCLLRAELDFSSWVLRRVERIQFEDDRNIRREMSVELQVREDAPVFVDADGGAFWVVPLMLLRRRTLVDFHMYDEDHKPMTTPGLRLVQQLDQSLLLAAAATVTCDHDRSLADDSTVKAFVQTLVTGTQRQVDLEWRRYASRSPGQGEPLDRLRGSPLFHTWARLLRRNFSLYVLLPVRPSRQRLLRLSFVEPVRWGYQMPSLHELDGTPGTWLYGASQGGSWPRLTFSHLAAWLGIRPTRIRFQVPSAERAASYHVELVAPPGVRIGRATLIAGRPNDDHGVAPGAPESRVTVDHERSATLMVGLHAVEVAPGSLCRTQVELRVQSAGWLASIVATSFAIAVVLGAVAWHVGDQGALSTEVDNIVVLLISTAAAAATVVAHREFGGVAARLLVGVRALAAVCMGLPVVGAGFVMFEETASEVGFDVATGTALRSLCGAALCLAVFLLAVWVFSRRVERAGRTRSPWNMTPDGRRPRRRARDVFRLSPLADEEAPDPKAAPSTEPEPRLSFHKELRKHGFHRPAVGIPSSDAWHERYDMTDLSHADAIRRLKDSVALPGAVGAGRGPSRCPRGDQSPCCRQSGPAATAAYERARGLDPPDGEAGRDAGHHPAEQEPGQRDGQRAR